MKKPRRPTFYDEAMGARIAIRCTQEQKDFLMEYLNSGEMREILLKYAEEKYEENKPPTIFDVLSGKAPIEEE